MSQGTTFTNNYDTDSWFVTINCKRVDPISLLEGCIEYQRLMEPPHSYDARYTPSIAGSNYVINSSANNRLKARYQLYILNLNDRHFSLLAEGNVVTCV